MAEGSNSQDRIVLHIDMDAFFASVEQRDDPDIRGRPVIVGADPMGGEGRGVVAASSYEARELGVHSAMPISTAWRLAPGAVYLRPRIGYYASISDEVFEDLAASVDVFEPASIDEAYAEVTDKCGGAFDAAERLGTALQRRVEHRYELTCSIGVGPNKLVAKIATDLDKPRGLTVVRPDDVRDVVGPLEARVIPGVGPKTSTALEEMGIRTVAELAAADPEHLRDAFGSWGPEMVMLARGRDDRPVDPNWERKSVGAEQTYLEDLPPDELAEALDEVVDEAVRRLHSADEQGRTITLKVRLEDFDTFTRARTLNAATDDADVIRRIAHELLGEAHVDDRVRLLGLRISGLERDSPRQANLDDWPADVLGEAEPKLGRLGDKVWRF